MKIGIIFHSQTGNTHSVALKLQEKLTAAGHAVNLEQVTPAGDARPGVKDLQLKTRPEVGVYDALVFGAPVQAFSLSPVMTAYLAQLSSLRGKGVACFVTKGLPFSWTGGNRAIAQMEEICTAKGGEVRGTGIVIWPNKNRATVIADLVEKIGGSF